MPLCGLVGWAVLKCDLEWLCLSLAGGGRCLSSYSGAVPERSLDGRAAPELGSRTALSGLGGAHLGRLGLRCALQRGWARSLRARAVGAGAVGAGAAVWLLGLVHGAF